MDEKNNVLVVTPHPDDAEGGAGGTIAKWAAQGRDVVLVVTTDGRHGTSDRSADPAELARTREKEQRNAAEVLGISEVVFLRFPDQGLVDGPELRERIVREIRRHRPHTVVTIDPNRRYIRHRDHMVTGRVTLDAVFPYARDHLAFPQHLEEGLEPHKVREVYLWSSEEPGHVPGHNRHVRHQDEGALLPRQPGGRTVERAARAVDGEAQGSREARWSRPGRAVQTNRGLAIGAASRAGAHTLSGRGSLGASVPRTARPPDL